MFTEKDRTLRAFFSIDIAGSTAYKNNNVDYTNYNKHWTRFYETFFNDFPSDIAGELYSNTGPEQVKAKEFKVWKLLGDEILYYYDVKNREALLQVTKSFFTAFRKYDKSIKEKYDLRAKATAWTAGFPIRNTRIKPSAGGNRGTIDFIGPDVDLGFRLTGTTRAGRMAVSMDLADLLASQAPKENFDFYHVGWAELKGVFQGNPYPVIWVSIDAPDRSVPWEDFKCEYSEAFIHKKAISAKELQNLFVEIRKALPNLNLFEPYIDKDEMPEPHVELWKKWREDAKKNEEVEFGGADFGPIEDE
jgi:hypothetical protein